MTKVQSLANNYKRDKYGDTSRAKINVEFNNIDQAAKKYAQTLEKYNESLTSLDKTEDFSDELNTTASNLFSVYNNTMDKLQNINAINNDDKFNFASYKVSEALVGGSRLYDDAPSDEDAKELVSILESLTK